MAQEEDRFRDLLHRRVREAREEALANDGYVAPDRMVGLETIGRLVALADKARPATPRKRWPLVAVLGATLAVLSVLLFVRVPQTEVELDVIAQEVGFALSTEQVLTDIINLSSLGATGLSQVEFPPDSGDFKQPYYASQPVSAIHLAVDTVGKRQGVVSLAALPLPAGTKVWLERTTVPRQYRLSISGEALIVQAAVRGPVRIALPSAAPVRQDFATPKRVTLRAAPGLLDLDFALPFGDLKLAEQLLVSNLSFSRIDVTELPAEDRTLVRSFSTILSGSLYFDALNGLAYPVRPGEALRFESSAGLLRAVQLNEEHIAVKFRGQVRGLVTGWGEVRRSLMPTWLEWLKSRHALSLFWVTALYVFGLIASVMRWWGGGHD
jgi:hypothetical protein